MKLVCVEPVTQHGFDLYFLAFTDEIPPNARDLTAVQNREWCYQREYTTLEIQCSHDASNQPARKTQPLAGPGTTNLKAAVEKEIQGKGWTDFQAKPVGHGCAFLGMELKTNAASENLGAILQKAGKTNSG